MAVDAGPEEADVVLEAVDAVLEEAGAVDAGPEEAVAALEAVDDAEELDVFGAEGLVEGEEAYDAG